MMPWWAVIIAIVAIVIIFLIVKGMVIARRCRRSFNGETKVVETKIDEDFESGDADSR